MKSILHFIIIVVIAIIRNGTCLATESRVEKRLTVLSKAGDFFSPHHDGKHFFIKPVLIAAAPLQSEIDAAALEAESLGRIVKIAAGGINVPAAMKELTSLPVTFRTEINAQQYDITVMSMTFTPNGAFLTIGCRFLVPKTSTILYFGKNNIAVSGKSGFLGELPILEASLTNSGATELVDATSLLNGQTNFLEFNLPGFKNNLAMGLGKDSRLSFSCGSFSKFSLSGFVKSSNVLEKESLESTGENRPLLLLFNQQIVDDWTNIFMEATVSSPFHAKNFPDLGFYFNAGETAFIDLSSVKNPADLPSCAQTSAEAWQGIAFPTFKVRLPKFFKLRSGNTLAMASGKNLFLDANGLLGDVVAQNVYALTEGYSDDVNKYNMSLNKLTATFSCNGIVTASMLGDIEIPWCGTGTKKSTPLLHYSVRFTDNRYEVFIKDTERGNFTSANYALSTGSQINFGIDKGLFLVNTIPTEKPVITNNVYNSSICKDFPVTISATQCTGKELIWSTGEKGSVITAKPDTTTFYTVRCQDDFCVSALSDSMKITVYKSLPQTILTSDRDAFCSYEHSTLRADNCVGKVEWKAPGENAFSELGADTRIRDAYFPNVNAASTFTYYSRCNLNGCTSPETARNITIHPAPSLPVLTSNAANNTIDRNAEVTLSGSCANGERVVWKNLPQMTFAIPATSSYAAICRNGATGCESTQPSSITISVLYFPPAAPSNLAFSGAGRDHLTLIWQDNSHTAYNEDGFQIIRSADAAHSNPQTIATVGQNVTSFHDTGLSEGATYHYQVIAYNKYDRGYSDWTARGTIVRPNAPVLTADNYNITRGSQAHVNGNCGGLGELVWLEPAGFSGGIRPQSDNTTYRAKCVNHGIDGEAVSITVNVYDPKPGAPQLYAESVNVPRGSQANVNGSCPSGGTLVWTVPVGFGGGQRIQKEATTYWAKCVKDNFESDGASITVYVRETPQEPRAILRSDRSVLKIGETTRIYAEGCDGTVVWSNGVQGNSFNGGPGNYSAICKKDGYADSERSYITIDKEGVASRPDLKADRQRIGENETTRIYAEGCDGTVVWSNGIQGNSFNGGPGNYSAICKKEGYTDSERSYITIDKEGIASRPNLKADRQRIGENETTRIYAEGCDGMVMWSNGVQGNSFNGGPGNYSAICKKEGYADSERSYITIDKEGIASRPNLKADRQRIGENETTRIYAEGCDGTVVWSNGVQGNSFNGGPGNYSAICKKEGYADSERSYLTIDKEGIASRPVLKADRQRIGENETTRIYAEGCDGMVVWSNGVQGNSFNGGPGNYSAICKKEGYADSERSYLTIDKEGIASRPVLKVDRQRIGENETTRIYAEGCDGTVVWSNGVQGNSFNGGPGNYSAICKKEGYADSERSYITIDKEGIASRPVLKADRQRIGENETTRIYAEGCDGTVVWSNGVQGNSFNGGPGNYSAICKREGYADSERSYITVDKEGIASKPVLKADRQRIGENETTRIYAEGCDGTVVWSNGVQGNSFNGGPGNYSAICKKEGYADSERSYITIEVRPEIIVNRPKISPESPSFCIGGSVNLSLNGCSSNQYQWRNPDDGASGSIQGGSFQVYISGTYTFTCAEGGDATTVNVASVQASPAPQISGPDQVAMNTSFTLTAKGCSGGTFKWSQGGSGNASTARITDGISEITTAINRDVQFSVSCENLACPGPAGYKTVQVLKSSEPDWYPMDLWCNGRGEIWEDLNPYSPTYGNTKCVGGTPQNTDQNPNWQATGNTCGADNQGKEWKDINQNSTTRNQTRCALPQWQALSDSCATGGIMMRNINGESFTYNQQKCCKKYTVTPNAYGGQAAYTQNNPATCTHCVVYRDCAGNLTANGLSNSSSTEIEGFEDSVECRNCYLTPK